MELSMFEKDFFFEGMFAENVFIVDWQLETGDSQSRKTFQL